MPRPKGSKNKTPSKIFYPRKCTHCDYIANNSTMYHYHKKTHDIIPDGKLCDHGCGQIATTINTNGKYICTEVAHQCPEYTNQLSERVKAHWKRPGSNIRKEKTKEKFLKHCCNNSSVREKQKKTLREKWGNFTADEIKEYRYFARRIRSRAQRWAKSQGYVLGQQTYHVDHKLSIFDAWKAGLNEDVINHPANLQVVEAKHNTKKGSKSSISLEDLLKEINALCEQAVPIGA